MKTIGYAAKTEKAQLTPFHFERRALRANDISIEILYCGVCHSDLHCVNNDWGGSAYPLVPGHEIVGKVLEVGSEVENHKVGDHVAVGCLVDSCRHCDQCETGQEQYCRNGFTLTYGSPDPVLQQMTYGGYSKHIVVREEFVLSVPSSLPLDKAAPILCAGITTFSPLKAWDVKEGSRVGIIGFGGLGHMAAKLAKAMGAHVTILSRSKDKEDVVKKLGVDQFLVSSSEDQMSKAQNSFDLIIDTVPVKHDVNPYIPLLDIDGTLVIVGQVGPLAEFMTPPMIFGRRRIAGSLIGGIPETQDVLNFCAAHNILPECKTIKIEEINEAFHHLEKGDVSYRFVIDMSSLEMK